MPSPSSKYPWHYSTVQQIIFIDLQEKITTFSEQLCLVCLLPKRTWRPHSCARPSGTRSQPHSETAWQPASPSHTKEATDAGDDTVTNTGTEPPQLFSGGKVQVKCQQKYAESIKEVSNSTYVSNSQAFLSHMLLPFPNFTLPYIQIS